MKISIIIPVYNCEFFLPVCIDHILKQTYDNWELLLIDDGSTDKSFAICCDYTKKDPRIRTFQQNNFGSGLARNKGLQHMNGEYVLFCDADDFFEIDALENFYNAINEFDSDLVISNYQEYKRNSEDKIHIYSKRNITEKKLNTLSEVRKNYYELSRMKMINAPWAKFYKVSIIKKHIIQFENIKRCQDILFNLSYYSHVKKLVVIDKVTYNYLTPDGNIYLAKFPDNIFDIFKYVHSLRTSFLIDWEVYTDETEKYFNTVMLKYIEICLRLNYKNNWKFTKKEQKEYYEKLLNDKITGKVVHNSVNGIGNNVIKLIIRSKSIFLIKFLSLGTLIVQKYFPIVVQIVKRN